MSNVIYENILSVLNTIEVELRKFHENLKNTPEPRKSLYRDTLFPKNPDKFTPMEGVNGTIHLVPRGQQLFLYRGQVKDHPTALARLYRGRPIEIKNFLERLKTTEFELLLKEHPAIIDLQQKGFHISFLGLAEHYGLNTELINLTSDPYIAAFFAVCKYSKATDSYIPITEDESEHGVFFKTPFITLVPFSRNKEFKLEIIGLQPFSRPGAQKAYAYKLYEGEDFHDSAHKMEFKHSKKCSEQIYEMFDKGKELFPSDPIVKKALRIRDSNLYSLEAFELTHSRYAFAKQKIYYQEKLQQVMNIKIVSDPMIKFSKEELNTLEKQWTGEQKEKFNRKIGPVRLQYYC